MNEEELNSLIEQLKGKGLDEDEIMEVFYESFKKGETSREDLEVMAETMGYELTDDFKNDETPDPIAEPGEVGAEGGDATKEDLEAAKALEPGETAEEFKDKIDDIEEGGESTAEDKTGEENPDGNDDNEDEKSEEDEAMKLFFRK